jgi:hypothetical protein
MIQLTLAGFDSVRASVQGPIVVLEGTVASYAAKCKIEAICAASRLRIRNHLRVTPAAFDASPATEML